MHGISYKNKDLLNRTMRDIKINIEKMDMVALTEKLNTMRENILRIRGDIKILRNLPKDSPEVKRLEKYRNFPIDDMLKIIEFMKLIVERKYPDETIYGIPIDSVSKKQEDLSEWFAILTIYINNLIEVGYNGE